MSTFRPCNVMPCKNDASVIAGGRKGFCSAHYNRLRRHGDPIGGRTPDGDPLRFLNKVVLPHRGKGCLIWPFARTKGGYAHIYLNGGYEYVHRIACANRYGPPPTPTHETAHSCGRGHDGCCNPLHVEWKTPAQNQADRIAHGTAIQGEQHGASKLTVAMVQEIRRLRGSMSQREIGQMFGVAQSTISKIQRGEGWAWLHERGHG